MKGIKYVIAILAVVGLIFTTACNKTDGSGNANNAGQLKETIQVTTYGGQNDSVVTAYTYDNQHRVVTQISVTTISGNLLGYDTTTYTYNTGSVVQFTSSTGISTTYTLNSQGFKQSDNLGDSWSYNAAGYMTHANTVSANNNITYGYNALNEVSVQTSVFGSTTTTTTYTYPTNPVGIAGTYWATGKSTGALFSSAVKVQNSDTTTLTGTYLVDAQNRLIQSTIQSTAAITSPVVTYFIYY